MLSDDKKRLFIIIGGAVLVLAIALGISTAISKKHSNDPQMTTQPPGLQIDVGDAPNVNTQKSLRCFVNGEYVGQFSLAECAKKNGVAAQALDVGIDDNGQLAAAPTASLAPPPAKPIEGGIKGNDPEAGASQEVVPGVSSVSGPTAACLRYSGGEWHQLTDSVTVGQCAQLLYDGRCERPGSASYGRWGEETLRLVPGRVEISNDNKSFRILVEQSKGCSVPLVKN